MTSLTIVRHLVECEGCGAIFGGRRGYQSPTEARAAAYAAGWRFPHLLTATGAASSATSDVCGTCAPTWEPKRRGQKTRYQRQLSVREVEDLEGDAMTGT